MRRLDFNLQRLTPLHSTRRSVLPAIMPTAMLTAFVSVAMGPCLLGIHPC
jgi:hypothetical protein